MNFLRVLWHDLTCGTARIGGAYVAHTEAGRVYSCQCGYGIMEAYAE